LRLLRGSMVGDRIQGQQILVNNTTEVFTVDGKSNAVNGTNGSQRVKATLTPKPKPTDTPSTPPSAVLKSSPRVGQEKP
jgi:lipopolysaccharide export system protein LptA